MQIPRLYKESYKCECGQIMQAECTENCHWEQRDGVRNMPVQSNRNGDQEDGHFQHHCKQASGQLKWLLEGPTTELLQEEHRFIRMTLSLGTQEMEVRNSEKQVPKTSTLKVGAACSSERLPSTHQTAWSCNSDNIHTTVRI